MNDDFDDLKPAEPIKFPSELPKAGWHAAVCAQAHNIGYQMFGNEPSSYPQAVLIFELASKRQQDGDYKGQPFLQSWKGSNVISNPEAKKKSNLTIMLEGWTGKGMSMAERSGFSLKNMVGVPAFLNVKHETGKDMVIRAKIASIGPLPEGITAPSLTVTEVPKWIGEMKAKAIPKPTAQAAQSDAPPHGDDDLPF